MPSFQEILDDEDLLNEMTSKCFEKYDEDKSGFIEYSELRTLLEGLWVEKNLGELNEETVNAFMTENDANKDGKLDQDEFKVLTRKLLQKYADA